MPYKKSPRNIFRGLFHSSMPAPAQIKIGGVSYLNAKPLLYGLEKHAHLSIELDVPSRLLDGLRTARLDVALLPVIDYQRLDNLRILPVGGICSDGPTLTVRIFSPTPIEKIESLACDPDSHTSVILAQVILAERYGIRPRIAPDGAAKLLIGDKVIQHLKKPADSPDKSGQVFPHQLDLGQAWKDLTGLPFVFAVWTARAGIELGGLPNILNTARIQGTSHVEEIVQREALPRGWPPDLARQYLTKNLQFEIGPRQLQAISRFYELAAARGLIPSPPCAVRLG
jgi:chorismate dehydratase